MRDKNKYIHEILDGNDANRDSVDADKLNDFIGVLDMFDKSEQEVPANLSNEIMNNLQKKPDIPLKEIVFSIIPESNWFMPALATAAAVVLCLIGYNQLTTPAGTPHNTSVTFMLDAPSAQSVQIIGTFNNWEKETIYLRKPKTSDSWVTTVKIPSGRHEYVFLVDGKEITVDPAALLSVNDGFGGRNSVIQI